MPSSLLDTLLDELGCQAFLTLAASSKDPCLAPFTGPVKLGPSLVVARRGAAPRLGYWTPMDRDGAATTGLDLMTPEALDVTRWVRDASTPSELLASIAARALQLCEVPPGEVAVAGHWSSGEVLGAAALLERDGWKLVPGEDLVRRLRKAKTGPELEEMRRVAEVTRRAFRRVAVLLGATSVIDGELWLEGERLRVGRLTGEVARILAEGELEQPEGSICAPAEEGAIPHSIGTRDRVLRPHESLVVDLYPKGALYCDCTRTFCVGEPPEALRAAHAHTLEALDLARDLAVVGVRGWSLQEAVCELFREAGYPTSIDDPETLRGYVHGLGHGVGYSIHEYPYFRQESPEAEGQLEEGDVFTLEPGLYEPDEGWAVRLEDLYYLGPHGLENLLPLPYEMSPRAWLEA